MKRYTVLFSHDSTREIDIIFDYLCSIDQDIAIELIDYIRNFCMSQLSLFPEIGVQRDYIKEGIRFFPVKGYGIYYFFDGETVYIAHILHQSQDIRTVF